MKKIIIDCDPGTDDFIAISLAIKSNMFDILGITTVEGNCSLENATNNALKCLDMNNRNDIEVYKGLKNNHLGTVDATDVFGNNGMGGIEYTKLDKPVNSKSAIDYLIETVNSNPNEITIVALGPLTNIAKCIEKDENFVNNVKELLIMGASSTFGNVTPHAEFNFYKDPFSADKVVNANFKSIKFFGWDTATKVSLLREYETLFKNSSKELPRFIYDITRTTEKRDEPLYGGAVISDILPIAYLIDESVARLEYCNIEVISDGERTGKSIVNYVEKSNCQYATKIHEEKLYNILFDALL